MDSALCYGLCTHGAWCQGMYLVCAARAVCPWRQGLCIRGVPCQRLYVHGVWCQETYIHDVWCQGFMSTAPEAACSRCGVPGNVHPWCVVPGLCVHGSRGCVPMVIGAGVCMHSVWCPGLCSHPLPGAAVPWAHSGNTA